MVIRFIFAFALVVFTTLPAYSQIDVWMDVDVGAGMKERDVDDAVMLIQAFHSPEVTIRGVSCVFGNSPHSHGYPMTQQIVRQFGPQGLKVYPGASSKKDLGKKTEAVEAMADALREKPMHIIAAGPLTNVGTLLQAYPELNERILSMVIVAGRRPGQHFAAVPESTRYFPDFNFEHDPAAMQLLLDNGVKIVMAPWEVSSHVWLRQADLDYLRGSSPTGAWIAETAKSWIAAWKKNNDVDGFTPFDTLALAWLTHPELIEYMNVEAWIEEGPDDLAREGSDRTKPYLLVKEQEKGELIYCYKPLPEFKRVLLQRLIAKP
ncbi:MAG: hypothetical protein COA73_18350 [Candidatus Hydrogenedentota bacterium]|nr:MAG: hypothetical protein COA73_18350 [Candidatus Hydrogenedentota bacterium]